jgi:hypothetical protein
VGNVQLRILGEHVLEVGEESRGKKRRDAQNPVALMVSGNCRV